MKVIVVLFLSAFSVFGSTAGAMERVTGIGGFFFRSENPKALMAWYEKNLGIKPWQSEVWQQEAGPTVFSPVDKNSAYYGKTNFMINFRVNNLDAMVKQLRGNGIKVEIEPEEDYGKFAKLEDPDGNAIQIWEPKETAQPKQ